MHFSWCLRGRVKICGLHITQDLVFIVRKAAEEESQAYFHNGSGPAKAVSPAEHIDSCHFNFTGELYWVNDQAHDGEHSWRNKTNKKRIKLTLITLPVSIIPVAKSNHILEDLEIDPLPWQILHSFSLRVQLHTGIEPSIEAAGRNASSSMDIPAQVKLCFTYFLTSHKKQASNPSYEVEPKRINGKCYDGQSKTDDEEYKSNKVCGSCSSSPSWNQKEGKLEKIN